MPVLQTQMNSSAITLPQASSEPPREASEAKLTTATFGILHPAYQRDAIQRASATQGHSTQRSCYPQFVIIYRLLSTKYWFLYSNTWKQQQSLL